MTVFVKVGSYYQGKYYGDSVKNKEKIKSHLKYIGFRSRERDPNDKVFFDKHSLSADWLAFYNRIDTHPALQHSKTVKAHKIIFSLRQQDYLEYKASGRDYVHIIRRVMEDLERKKGVELDWIAVKHDQNHHPHCHVVVRAVSDSTNGPSKRIYFRKEDIAEMKRSFEYEVELHRVQTRSKIREWERMESHFVRDLFQDFTRSIEQKVKEIEKEKERERERSRRRGR